MLRHHIHILFFGAGAGLLSLVACGGDASPSDPDASSSDDGGAALDGSSADATDAPPPLPDALDPLWTSVPSGVRAPLRDVWGTSADDFYVVGWQGTILHWEDGGFTSETGGGNLQLDVVGGDGAGRVWALGEDPDTANGVILERSSEGTWSPDPATPLLFDTFRDIVVVGPGDVYAVSSSIYHLVGETWVSLGNPFHTAPHSLWVSAASDPRFVLAGGQNFLAGEIAQGFEQEDGSVVWVPQDIPSTDIIDAVWGFAPDDLYASHFSGNLHFDGNAWQSTVLGAAGLFDLWGASSADLYGVGFGGAIAHREDGVGATEPSGVNESLYGVWGDGDGTIIAVGADGAVVLRAP